MQNMYFYLRCLKCSNFNKPEITQDVKIFKPFNTVIAQTFLRRNQDHKPSYN